jgi:hypothetical protein
MSCLIVRSPCSNGFQLRRKMNNPMSVSHLKNSIRVRKGKKDKGKLKAEG